MTRPGIADWKGCCEDGGRLNVVTAAALFGDGEAVLKNAEKSEQLEALRAMGKMRLGQDSRSEQAGPSAAKRRTQGRERRRTASSLSEKSKWLSGLRLDRIRLIRWTIPRSAKHGAAAPETLGRRLPD